VLSLSSGQSAVKEDVLTVSFSMEVSSVAAMRGNEFVIRVG